MNRQELVEQCTPEQLAGMVIRYQTASEVKNEEIAKLKWEISNLEESNERLTASVDTYVKFILPQATEQAKELLNNNKFKAIKIVAQYEEKASELKSMLDNETIFNSLQNMIYSIPDDKIRKLENTIENMDDVLWELFGITHNDVTSPVTFKQILEKRLEIIYGDKERNVKKKYQLINGICHCPTCSEKIKSYYKFCTECGQAILRCRDTEERKKL